MARKMLGTLLLLSASATSSVVLADYTVQIGAYERPELANPSAAARVAEVHTIRSASGLTRILVGRFGSRAEAQVALAAVKAAGYHDAFIIRSPTGTRVSSKAPSIAPVSTSESQGVRWDHLDEAVRAKLVLLDGRPHIKDGDTFTPLEDYTGQ